MKLRVTRWREERSIIKDLERRAGLFGVAMRVCPIGRA
jgi:hypothetical protein